MNQFGNSLVPPEQKTVDQQTTGEYSKANTTQGKGWQAAKMDLNQGTVKRILEKCKVVSPTINTNELMLTKGAGALAHEVTIQ